MRCLCHQMKRFGKPDFAEEKDMIEQFAMAYRVEQDRIRAMLPAGAGRVSGQI